MRLTDAQWSLIEPLFPSPRTRRPGRPALPARDVLDGVLWVLRTGAQWYALPSQYPSYQTCHRRFQHWVRQGLFVRLLRALTKELEALGLMDLEECFVDGSFAPAKKGGSASEKPNAARAPSSWPRCRTRACRSP
jgi:transposase